MDVPVPSRLSTEKADALASHSSKCGKAFAIVGMGDLGPGPAINTGLPPF